MSQSLIMMRPSNYVSETNGGASGTGNDASREDGDTSGMGDDVAEMSSDVSWNEQRCVPE